MNDIELIDEIVRRADEHQKQKERDFAISELEEIKAEINKYALHIRKDTVLEILDKHIIKADCDNDCEHCEWTECPKD